MKKILVTLSLVFAFSVVASAQANGKSRSRVPERNPPQIQQRKPMVSEKATFEDIIVSSQTIKPKPTSNQFTVELVNTPISSFGRKPTPKTAQLTQDVEMVFKSCGVGSSNPRVGCSQKSKVRTVRGNLTGGSSGGDEIPIESISLNAAGQKVKKN